MNIASSIFGFGTDLQKFSSLTGYLFAKYGIREKASSSISFLLRITHSLGRFDVIETVLYGLSRLRLFRGTDSRNG